MHDMEGEMLSSGGQTERPSDLQFPAKGTGIEDVYFIVVLESNIFNIRHGVEKITL